MSHLTSVMSNKVIRQSGSINSIASVKPSSQFASKSQRFIYKSDRLPGPGAYQYKTSNYKLPEYHASSLSKERSTANVGMPIKDQHKWILGSNRSSFMENKSMTAVGPGAYYDGGSMHDIVVGRTNWGKSQRFYIKNIDNSLTVPGPGSYDSKTAATNCYANSVFKSKSPRSFIQRIQSQHSTQMKRSQSPKFNDNNPQKATIEYNRKSNIKQREVAEVKGSKKIAKSSVFASNIPRFQDNTKFINNSLGPGAYQLPSLHKQKSKQKLPRIITVRDQEKLKKIVKPVPPEYPGPASYDPNTKTIVKQIQKIGNVMINCGERFTQNKILNPGPGHYMSNKKTYKDEIQKANKKHSPEKPSFNSSSNRSPLELNTKENPLCAYNLSYFDIENRVRKSQQHIEKLKIMDVTVPAFNTKVRK